MTNIINMHNNCKLVLKTGEKQKGDLCNCNQQADYPLTGKCLVNNVVYKATVTSSTERPTCKSYIGICETSFKTRFNNHKSSFNIEEKKNISELSKYVWELKNKKSDFQITWSMLKKKARTLTELKDVNYVYGRNISLLLQTNHRLLTKELNY